jgi:hypothetical protein
LSILKSLSSYINQKVYSTSDLFHYNELWGSWDHHTRFSSVDQHETLLKINDSQQQAHGFLKNAGWLIITLGSSFVYELKDGSFVANCHKVPTDKFVKRMIPASETIASFTSLIEQLKLFNPLLKIIFTISPVRHLRDGFVENNRSKANLILAVEQLVEQFHHVHYFPSYELIIDDLRDHRFYAEDLVHPNYAATNYVWEKFKVTCIDESSLSLIKELQVILSAKNHKPFNPMSMQHQQFLETHLQKAEKIKESHSYLNLSEEITYFRQMLKK